MLLKTLKTLFCNHNLCSFNIPWSGSWWWLEPSHFHSISIFLQKFANNGNENNSFYFIYLMVNKAWKLNSINDNVFNSCRIVSSFKYPFNVLRNLVIQTNERFNSWLLIGNKDLIYHYFNVYPWYAIYF